MVINPVVFTVVLTSFIVFVDGESFFFFVFIFLVLVAQGLFEGLADSCRNGFLALLVSLRSSINLHLIFAARNDFGVGR